MAFDVKICSRDLRIFASSLEDSLKRHFPFQALKILVSSDSDLGSIIENLNTSERQRERAYLNLLKKEPFWDRIGNQVLIPFDWLGEDHIAVALLNGVPKGIGAEESTWIIGLASKFLDYELKAMKMDSLDSAGKEWPGYLERIITSGESGSFSCAYLHLGPSSRFSVRELTYLLNTFFATDDFEYTGGEEGKYWFLAEALSLSLDDMLKAIGRIAFVLNRKAVNLMEFTFLKHASALREISLFRKLAKSFGARVFSDIFLDNIKRETGVDVWAIKDFLDKVGQKGFLGLGAFSSPDEIKGYLENKEALVQEAGDGNLLFCLGSSERKVHVQKEIAHELFKTFKEIDHQVKVGFVSTDVQVVSPKTLLADLFCAFYHAHLLGPGNMAFFDHVTCNVHGDLLYQLGDVKGAIAAYRRGRVLFPHDTNLLNSLGAGLAELNRLSEAMRCFEKVLELEPSNTMARYNLSGILLRRGNLDEALTHIDRAIQEEKWQPSFYKRKFEIFFSMEDFQEAYKLTKDLLKGQLSKEEGLFKYFALSAFHSGDWPIAKKYLNRALKIEPDDGECLVYLASGFVKYESDLVTAERLLKNASALKVKDKRCLTILKELEKKFKELDKTRIGNNNCQVITVSPR